MVVGESRSDLLSWLNSVFGLDYSKVEHCGTGAAYCQIMDSIYGGIPMAKVKFGVQISDYDARNNMKVFQAAFNKHKITRQIDTEKLIKCRLQDNLELLQWLKRHWLENKDVNVPYDAVARRRGSNFSGVSEKSGEKNGLGMSRRTTLTNGSGINTPSGNSRVTSRVASSGNLNSGGNQPLDVPKQRVASTSNLSHRLVLESRAAPANPNTVARDLTERTTELKLAQSELVECKMMMDSLETERNFYFNKLREIEILSKKIQDQHARSDPTAEFIKLLSVLDVMSEIQEILYSTEKGFEIQDSADVESF